jgi:acyl-coenzyme A synthetase/AMP-(fatty) acid ligase
MGGLHDIATYPELTVTARGRWPAEAEWQCTTRDEDGFYTIVDRKKDMIVSGGFDVFPREIEDVLSRDPTVASAAMIGVPDDEWGEAPSRSAMDGDDSPGQTSHS